MKDPEECATDLGCPHGTFVIKGGSTCTPCPIRCSSCSSFTLCTTCNTKLGYRLSGKKCTRCKSPCSSCSSSDLSKCTSCEEGFYLRDERGGICS